MSHLRYSLLVGVAVAIGCGGASARRDRVDDEPAGAGGTAGAAGATGTGGTETGGSGGAGGEAPSVPGQSERETEILSPLFTDDETIEMASGEELVELAMAIGLARGYAMCRCFFSPSGPPESIEEMLGCASDESGVPWVSTEIEARCVTERIDEVEGIEDVLRCQARRARPLGLLEFTVCSTGTRPETPPLETCAVSPEIGALFQECRSSFYCEDESRVLGARCNTTAECPDLSDEKACLDVDGRDRLICEGEIWHPLIFCRDSLCGVTSEPPMCDPALPERFLCEDGSDVDANVVCDRAMDCPDGQDEAHCLR